MLKSNTHSCRREEDYEDKTTRQFRPVHHSDRLWGVGDWRGVAGAAGFRFGPQQLAEIEAFFARAAA
jgi:hypothetical protein